MPRIRLASLSGSGGNAPSVDLTSLLRSQMRAVQTADNVELDFVTADTRVQGLVTAVKDIDATAGGWLELFAWFSWLWPWQSMTIQGQVLGAGARGEGITVSIGSGAHQPSAFTFWYRPRGGTAPAGVTVAHQMQCYYDLVPAAATWAIYEAARLGDTAAETLTENGAVSHGYLATGYSVAALGGSDPTPFYEAAVAADPTNQATKLALVPDLTSNRSANQLEAIFGWWLGSLAPLGAQIWEVPGAP